ncbi:MAG: hypothetical protein R3E02_14460 [Blastomonas sp.]
MNAGKRGAVRSALCVLAIIAIAQTPLTAAGTPEGCAAITALIAPGLGQARQVSLAFTRKGQIDVLYKGRGGLLSGASECNVSGFDDSGGLELDCSWEAEDYGAALLRLNRYRVELGQCLPSPWEEDPSPYASDTYRIVERHKVEIELDEELDESAEVELSLSEFMGSAGPKYDVHVRISR